MLKINLMNYKKNIFQQLCVFFLMVLGGYSGQINANIPTAQENYDLLKNSIKLLESLKNQPGVNNEDLDKNIVMAKKSLSDIRKDNKIIDNDLDFETNAPDKTSKTDDKSPKNVKEKPAVSQPGDQEWLAPADRVRLW